MRLCSTVPVGHHHKACNASIKKLQSYAFYVIINKVLHFTKHNFCLLEQRANIRVSLLCVIKKSVVITHQQHDHKNN